MKTFTNIISYKTLIFSSACIFSSFVFNAQAYDTSTISAHPTTTISLQSNQTYDFGWRNIYGDSVGDNHLFKCQGQSNITLKNVTIRNTNRFGIWIKGCDNLTITDVNLRNTGWGGIRFENGTANSNITLSNINGNVMGGHGIELWDVDGFNISNIRLDNTPNHAGLLINRSKNGKVGRIWGVYNNSGGGYASMRFANNAGPNIQVSEVVSRDSGRGYFTVSGSRGISVNTVNIARASSDGIYLQDGSDNNVQGGSSRGNPNCRIRNNSGSYINADCGGSIAN